MMPTQKSDDDQSKIPYGLGEELEQTLALLAGMSAQAADGTIALLPFGDRARLATYGVIDAEPDSDLAQAGWPSDFSLTPEGLAVIDACAQKWPDRGPERPERDQAQAEHVQTELDDVFEGLLRRGVPIGDGMDTEHR